MATTKKPTTAKKPAAKKTAVIKAHRGMAHVPRGRRRPLNPRQRPQVEPRRRGDDRPRAPGIDRPQMPRGRNPRLPANFFQMSPNARKQFLAVRAAKDATSKPTRRRDPLTPAMRSRLMEMRRRAQQRRQLPPLQGRKPTATEVAQLKADRDRFNKRQQEAQAKMRANIFGRGRKPTQATQTPKVATPRKRPTGTPRGPQVSPRKRNFRFRGRT